MRKSILPRHTMCMQQRLLRKIRFSNNNIFDLPRQFLYPTLMKILLPLISSTIYFIRTVISIFLNLFDIEDNAVFYFDNFQIYFQIYFKLFNLKML